MFYKYTLYLILKLISFSNSDIKPDTIIPVIIINWNGSNDTIECLNSLEKTKGVDFNIYVVDNNSTPSEFELLAAYCKTKNIKYFLPQKENLGFAKANNLVFKQLLSQRPRPKYIALLNNDTVVDSNWLSNLHNAAVSHMASMVSSKMINYFDRSTMDNAGHKMLNTGEVIPVGHGQKTDHHTKSKINFGACAGACLYDSNMLQNIGLFDEHFSTGYEDAELGMRAKLRGYKCIYEPSAIVYHKGGSSIKKVFDQDYAIMVQNAIWYSYLKNVPTLVFVLNLPFIILKNIVVLIILVATGKFSLAKLITKSLYQNLIKNRRKLRSPHRKQRVQNITSFKIINSQSFFLFSDLKRFFRIIKRKSSALESYG